MKSDLSASKRFAPFLSLVGLLAVISTLTLFFSGRILSDATSVPKSPSGALFSLVLVLPLTLAGAVGYQIWQMIRDRRAGRPGTSLKIRISFYFLLTTLLASIPQAALSLSFIDRAMKTWSSQKWGDALQGGLQTALDYHLERVQNLTDTTQSSFLGQAIHRALVSKGSLSVALAEVNLRADGFQVFDDDGKVILHSGRPDSWLKLSTPLPLVDGTLPKQSVGPNTVLHQLRHLTLAEGKFAVVVSLILPVGFDQTSRGLTEALDNFNQLRHSSDTYRILFFVFYVVLALPILLIALLMSFTQSDDLVRPLINLEAATRRIAAGDYTTRLLGPERSELSFLADSFNTMTAELAISRTNLQQSEKITAWQEIARRLAHELRNPLTPIRLSAERIQRRNRTDPANLAEIVEPAVSAILTEVVRLDTLLKEFAGFARLPAPQKTSVLLKPLVTDLLATYQASHPLLTTSSDGVSETVRLMADPAQLEQVFTNLIKNAVEAMNGQGEITVVTNLVKKGQASYCRIQLHDTGPGIGADLRDRVFQPYVTSKPSGTGLGLAIVERILFDHQGRVWFESQPGFGTTFFLDLPMEDLD